MTTATRCNGWYRTFGQTPPFPYQLIQTPKMPSNIKLTSLLPTTGDWRSRMCRSRTRHCTYVGSSWVVNKMPMTVVWFKLYVSAWGTIKLFYTFCCVFNLKFADVISSYVKTILSPMIIDTRVLIQSALQKVCGNSTQVPVPDWNNAWRNT